jgi:hypothetical protein
LGRNLIIIFHNCPISLNISYFVSWICWRIPGLGIHFHAPTWLNPIFEYVWYMCIYIYKIMCHYSFHKNHQFPKFNWHPIYP